ncbi:hypothetical protein CONPUDRAFT_170318 [Coniophora puteana RWD-64-598 SS2]|uniref:Uncharacterized protein n=1 Tax=Coniophora puteana (strain RWD-64-598) TaxID=741705 RepID=R7SDB3_CONPW|nr:uncharacterized protein CONPUDRAFT_170318 [Coniophora puteana RWD-64-598 SS2]EIW74153.1 hypothetical protein CONPUDRAFT_170318 [Coniophora puteana RWD-64-598 SS2]
MSETLAIPFDVTAVTQDELVSLGLKGSYISHRNSIPEAVLVIEKEEVHRVPVSAFYAKAFHAFSYKFELLKFTIAKLLKARHEGMLITVRLIQTFLYMDRLRDRFFEEMLNSGSGRSPAFDYYLWLDWLCKINPWSKWCSSEHDDGIRRKAEQQYGVTSESVSSGVKNIEDIVDWKVYQESRIEPVDSCGFGYRLKPIGRAIPEASEWSKAIIAAIIPPIIQDADVSMELEPGEIRETDMGSDTNQGVTSRFPSAAVPMTAEVPRSETYNAMLKGDELFRLAEVARSKYKIPRATLHIHSDMDAGAGQPAQPPNEKKRGSDNTSTRKSTKRRRRRRCVDKREVLYPENKPE